MENSCSLNHTKPTRRLANVGENLLVYEIRSVSVDHEREDCQDAWKAPGVK